MILALIEAVGFVLLVWAIIRAVSVLIKYSNELAKGNRPSLFPRTIDCERCDKQIAKSKRLKSFRDYLFGGWACPNCGSEYDQLNNLRIARAHDGHLRDSRRRARHLRVNVATPDDRTPVERLIDE